tara:strand:- start:612 stop:1751 length:1140 start_codon:yes stop_codon:yes gene_type:complete
MTFVSVAVFWMFRFLLPLYLVKLDASPFEIGVIMGSYALSVTVSAIPLGYLSDRIGRKQVIIVGIILTAVSSFAIASRSDVYEIMGAYVIMGLGLSSIGPSLDAAVADNTKSSNVGVAFGKLTTAVHMGTALGPASAGILAANIGLVNSLYQSAIISLTIFAMLPFALKSLHGGGKSSKTLDKNSLRRIKPNIVIGWAGFFASFTLWGGVTVFLPIYAISAGIEISIVGMIFALAAVGTFLSRIPMGIFVDKFRQEPLLIVLGVVGASLTASTIGIVSTAILLAIIMITIAITRSASNVSSHALVARTANPDERGLVMGTATASRAAGNTIGPIIMGIVIGSHSYQAAFIVLALTSIIGVIVTILVATLVQRRKSKITN